MADFFTAFPAQGVKPQAGMSLGEMINIARGAQELQQAQQMNPLLLKRAAAELSSAETGSQSAAYDFANKQSKGILDSLTSLINNPLIISAENNPDKADKQAVGKLMEDFARHRAMSLGVPKDKVDQVITPFIKKAEDDVGGVRQHLKDTMLNVLDASSRLSAMQPTGPLINTGAGGAQIQTGIFGASPGQPVGGTTWGAKLPPGSRVEPTGKTDIYNRPTAIVKDENGNIVGETFIPAGVPPEQPPKVPTQPPGFPPPGVPPTQPRNIAPENAPVRIPAGETPESGNVYRAATIDAKAQAPAANVGLNNIRTIRQYLPLAQTGKYSEAVAGLQSVMGNIAGSKPEELAAAARDIIEKNIADLSLQKNAALGGKFAASLEAAQSSLASAGKNPTAIAKSLEQLEPLFQHVYNYQLGLDRSIQKSPTKYYVKPSYDSAMNDAFDLSALMMKNAYDKGGKEGLDKFIKANNINLREQQRLFDKLEAYGRLIRGEM